MSRYRTLQRKFNNQHNCGARDEAAIILSAEDVLLTLETEGQRERIAKADPHEDDYAGGRILSAARSRVSGQDTGFAVSTVEWWSETE